MIRTRKKDTAGEAPAEHEAAGHDEDEAAETITEAEAVPDDLAAAAVELRQAATDADEQAARCRGEAASVVAAARADADRIISEGQARALPLIADATALERKAATLSGRSKHLEHAARQEALAVEHEARAADLSAEREHLTGVIIAGLDGKLSQLGEDRERLEAAVAAARVAGDVSLIAEGRRQLDATAEAIEALSEQHASALTRVRQIGDEAAPGELADALTDRRRAPGRPPEGVERALPLKARGDRRCPPGRVARRASGQPGQDRRGSCSRTARAASARLRR